MQKSRERERVEGETIVIFGGSSGIGRAAALAAAAAGARVRAVGRDAAALDALTLEAAAVGTAIADVRDEAAVGRALDGLDRIDHVLVSAGTVTATPLLASGMEALRAPFDERVFGVMHVVRQAAQRMTDGSFVFVTGDLVERPIAGVSAVGAAATAVEALARTWTLELAPLRFNIVSPGSVDTPLQGKIFGEHRDQAVADQAARIPLRRIGRPEELAQAVLSLFANPFVNGATLHVDGGMRLSG
jgi:NAD(P)-dependent dehydrogenase (short-subunit alcohol dehydrogenase family)